MVEISYLLQNGSGFVFQALIADFVAFMILGYISITTVYPFVKNVFELKKIAKKVGGPKPHWFWGDIKKVREKEKIVLRKVLILFLRYLT